MFCYSAEEGWHVLRIVTQTVRKICTEIMLAKIFSVLWNFVYVCVGVCDLCFFSLFLLPNLFLMNIYYLYDDRNTKNKDSRNSNYLPILCPLQQSTQAWGKWTNLSGFPGLSVSPLVILLCAACLTGWNPKVSASQRDCSLSLPLQEIPKYDSPKFNWKRPMSSVELSYKAYGRDYVQE